MAGKIFLISAPSGAGKTSLVEALIERYGPQYNLNRVITYTSKEARAYEIDGIHYHFVSEQDFERKIDQGFFAEWSKAYKAYYGSPADIYDMLQTGKSYILIIDRAGAQKVLAEHPDVISIWICTKSLDVLQERLYERNSESAQVISDRLCQAREEIRLESSRPIFMYHVLNHDFDHALASLVTIIKRELSIERH